MDISLLPKRSRVKNSRWFRGITRDGGQTMFDKLKLIAPIAAALLGGALLASSAFAQQATSLYGGGQANAGVGAGGGGGTGMSPAGGGPGAAGGTAFGRWQESPGTSGGIITLGSPPVTTGTPPQR